MNTKPEFEKYLEAISSARRHRIEGTYIDEAYAQQELREAQAMLDAARHQEIVSLLAELIAVTHAQDTRLRGTT